MTFIELGEKRRSIRGFKPDGIPERLLNEAGRGKTRNLLEEPVRYECW